MPGWSAGYASDRDVRVDDEGLIKVAIDHFYAKHKFVAHRGQDPRTTVAEQALDT